MKLISHAAPSRLLTTMNPSTSVLFTLQRCDPFTKVIAPSATECRGPMYTKVDDTYWAKVLLPDDTTTRPSAKVTEAAAQMRPNKLLGRKGWRRLLSIRCPPETINTAVVFWVVGKKTSAVGGSRSTVDILTGEGVTDPLDCNQIAQS